MTAAATATTFEAPPESGRVRRLKLLVSSDWQLYGHVILLVVKILVSFELLINNRLLFIDRTCI